MLGHPGPAEQLRVPVPGTAQMLVVDHDFQELRICGTLLHGLQVAVNEPVKLIAAAPAFLARLHVRDRMDGQAGGLSGCLIRPIKT